MQTGYSVRNTPDVVIFRITDIELKVREVDV